jgi:hypothetical protein
MSNLNDAPGQTRTGSCAQNLDAKRANAPGDESEAFGEQSRSAANRQDKFSASVGSVPSSTTGTPEGRLLARLDGVLRTRPGRGHARCPAHEDRSPSLSIRADGERVLVHCFAGCDPSDILAAVGLAWKDLYPDRWERALKRPNEGAEKYARRTLADMDPMDLERAIVLIAAADRRAGKPETAEDRARTDVAIQRLRAARGY